MLRLIIGASLKFRFLVVTLAISLVTMGYLELRNLPIDVFPEFAPPMVEIQVPSLGLTAKEVEGLVTIPLEEALSGIAGLDVLRSKSVEQLASVKLLFKPGTDLMKARQLVQERMAMAVPTLPSWANRSIILPPLSATSRCMKIGVTSKKLSLIELSDIGYWTIRQRLLKVAGVANVARWGERIETLQIQADPERMRSKGVTLQELMEATSGALNVSLLRFNQGHHIGSGGWLETPSKRVQIELKSPILRESKKKRKREENPIGKVVIKVGDGGKTILIKDVANVVVNHPPMIGDAIINDRAGLLLIVEKYPWANTLDVTRKVEIALDELRPSLPDIEIDHEIFRPATFIEMSISNLSISLIIGALLMSLMLVAFLLELRTVFISLVAVPLSLVGAGIVLHLYGATINTMVLAGLIIALGDIVDDAIIDIENVIRRLRLRKMSPESSKSLARTILDASLEVRGSIVYATVIEVLAIVPVFFMEGLSGAFFKPLALSYALAILVSMVVALTVTPAMAMIMFRNDPPKDRDSNLVIWLKASYERVLQNIILAPRRAYTVVGLAIVCGLLTVSQLGQELLPSFKERDFLMHWLTKPGTSLPEMQRITIQASRELREIPGVRNFGAHIGQALIMDEVVGVYFGENWISIDPLVDYDETLAKVQEVVDGYPGIFRDVQTYLKERIREVLTGAHEAITVRIFGRELPILREKAEEVKMALRQIEGVVDLHVELQEEIPQIEIKVDPKAATRFGLKPGDIRRAASFWISGEEVGDLHTGDRVYDVRVWTISDARASLSDIQEMMLDTPSGGHVRLDQVASVEIRPTPNVIARENLKRKIDVGANVKGRDLGSVYRDVERALAKIEFPSEYHPELLGEYTERLAAQKKLFLWSALVVVAIFLLLQTSCGSFRLAGLSFLCLPAALVGGVLAAFLFDGGIISLGSLVGFLTILGISARNSIMLINHFQHLEKDEGMTFGPKLVLRGARERISPIMMTVLTTALALAPLVFYGNIPGHEIEHPMAIVILGGLVTATLLNLFVIPSFYLLVAKSSR